MADRIENQVERFAPGFRKLILKRSVITGREPRTSQPEFGRGDFNGGSPELDQLVFRPTWQRHRTAGPVFISARHQSPRCGRSRDVRLLGGSHRPAIQLLNLVPRLDRDRLVDLLFGIPARAVAKVGKERMNADLSFRIAEVEFVLSVFARNRIRGTEPHRFKRARARLVGRTIANQSIIARIHQRQQCHRGDCNPFQGHPYAFQRTHLCLAPFQVTLGSLSYRFLFANGDLTSAVVRETSW